VPPTGGGHWEVERWREALRALAFNVLALGAVADFETQNCQYTTNVDAM
jgi:hypothetical protein